MWVLARALELSNGKYVLTRRRCFGVLGQNDQWSSTRVFGIAWIMEHLNGF